MDYNKEIKDIDNQIEQLKTQANAQINQLLGRKQLLKELKEEEEANKNGLPTEG